MLKQTKVNVIVYRDQIINVHLFTLWNTGQSDWFLLYGPSLRKAPSNIKKTRDLSTYQAVLVVQYHKHFMSFVLFFDLYEKINESEQLKQEQNQHFTDANIQMKHSP